MWLLQFTLLIIVSGISSTTDLSGNNNRSKRDAHIKYKQAWVQPCSITYSSNGTKPDRDYVELVATELVDDFVMEKAARLLQLMIRFASRISFSEFSRVSVGIFSSTELLTDAFPEYEVSEQCKYTCDGDCSSLCYNGVPRANSSSFPGDRAVVVDSNIVCGADDPEHGSLNLLVKTYAESLYNIFPDQVKQLMQSNFETVKNKWNIYPDTTKAYWTEAVVTWFNARNSEGGMNICGPNGELCTSEWQNRQNIKTKDEVIFGALNALFNYEREYLVGRITTCSW